MDEQTRNDELTHYGVKGMKWGVIGGVGAAAAMAARRYNKNLRRKEELERSKKVNTRQLSDAELNARINRLRLEQQYADLVSPKQQKIQNSGKAFVGDVVKQSGKVIATQLATYTLGTAVNATAKAIAVKQPNESYSSVLKESYKRAFKSAFSVDAVNAKKGRKD